MQQGTLAVHRTEAGRDETKTYGPRGPFPAVVPIPEFLYALMTIDGEKQYSMTT